MEKKLKNGKIEWQVVIPRQCENIHCAPDLNVFFREFIVFYRFSSDLQAGTTSSN